MSREHENPSGHEAPPPFKTSGQEPGLLESAKLLEKELRGVVHDHLVLAALETRQAGESLVKIVGMGLIVACLLSTAWLATVGALVIVLIQQTPIPAGVALLLVAAIHCAVAFLLVSGIRKRSRNLLFPATVSRLGPSRTDANAELSP